MTVEEDWRPGYAGVRTERVPNRFLPGYVERDHTPVEEACTALSDPGAIILVSRSAALHQGQTTSPP